jgi:prolyl-tRNA synthetase
MKLSQYFLPTLKEEPREAKIPSHRYMLRAGMIRQLASGIYTWLPLGLKVLKKIENIVREEMNKAGAVELLMPTMQPIDLWKESGRGDYGKETLVATDRHDNQLIYGPTNEEAITDIFRNNVKSYKSLPLNLYHIQWKFRDEIRPRFGVMRGREFFMKDAYSFDTDEESAKKSYDNMFRAYLKIFKRMELKAIPFKADTGQIGGDMSHEFQIIADTGESKIFYDSEFENFFEKDPNKIDLTEIKKIYARTEELHDEKDCPIPAELIKTARGIEVGHIFYLGDKYSKPLKAMVQAQDGKNVTVKMGCYGIGVSRLIGAIIEANHDDQGIIWPKSVSPFDVILINLKPGDVQTDNACDKLYEELNENNIECLYDDRKGESAGVKFANANLIGTPYQIIIGPKSIADGKAEVITRRTGEKQLVAIKDIIKKIT